MSTFDLIAHLHRQRAFSLMTFGPGARTAGVCDHIRKELAEIEAAPADITEWVDVILLAFDGAYRSGATPEQIVAAIETKQTRNEARTWPDWRTADPNRAIEHVREGEAPAAGEFRAALNAASAMVAADPALRRARDNWGPPIGDEAEGLASHG